MIRWMRQHNENPGSSPRVSFFGFDMQSPTMSMQNVSDYLTRVDPGTRPLADSRYDCFRSLGRNFSSYAGLPKSDRDACHEGMQQVYDDLLAHRLTYEGRSSSGDFALALQSARVAVQGEELYSISAGNQAAGARRDQAMAENVGWLLDQAGPNAKIVLWAHNGHVGDRPASMGRHLRNTFGNQMVVMGFDFYQGSLQAVTYTRSSTLDPLAVHQTGTPPADTYEAIFHETGLARLVVDLRAVPRGTTAGDWLVGPHRFRSIGAAFSAQFEQDFYYSARLPDEFDVMIYFQDTTAAIPVR